MAGENDTSAPLKPGMDLALRLVIYFLIAALLVYMLYELRALLMILAFAITIAAAIAPLAEFAETKKIPRVATVVSIYFVVALVYIFLSAALIPTVLEQGHKFYDNLPGYIEGVNTWYQKAANLAGSQADQITIKPEELRELSKSALHRTLDWTAGFFGLLVNGILTLFLAAYFVVEAKTICPSLLNWLPKNARERCLPLMEPLQERIGGYIRGQLLVAFAVAVFLSIGLSLLQVKYSLVLGILAGLLNVVPYIGSIISMGFAILVAFNQTPLLALGVIALYGLEQWAESTVMVPLLLGRHVQLHPLVVMLSIIAGGTLMGVPGALVAIPLSSAMILLAEELYLKPRTEAEAAQSD